MTAKNNELLALRNLQDNKDAQPRLVEVAVDAGPVFAGVALPVVHTPEEGKTANALVCDGASAIERDPVSPGAVRRRLPADGPLGVVGVVFRGGQEMSDRMKSLLAYNYPLRVLGDWLRVTEPEKGASYFEGEYPLTDIFGIGAHGYGFPDDPTKIPAGSPELTVFGANNPGLCRHFATHIGALPFVFDHDNPLSQPTAPYNVEKDPGRPGVARYTNPTDPGFPVLPLADTGSSVVFIGYGFICRDRWNLQCSADTGSGVLSVVSFGRNGGLLSSQYLFLPSPIVGGATNPGLATTVRTRAEELARAINKSRADEELPPVKVVVYPLGDLLRSSSFEAAKIEGGIVSKAPGRGLLRAVPTPDGLFDQRGTKVALQAYDTIEVCSSGYVYTAGTPFTSTPPKEGAKTKTSTQGPEESESGVSEGPNPSDVATAKEDAKESKSPKVAAKIEGGIVSKKIQAKQAPAKVFGYKDELNILRAALDPTADPMNVLLIGHTGVGKTTIVESLAVEFGAKFYRLNLNGETGVDEFVGRWTLKNGATVWVDGVLPRAMKEAGPVFLLLDEVNVALPEINFVLQSVLDHARTLVLSEKDGSKIIAGDGFRVIASMNPPEDYIGTKDLNFAFRSRFGCVVEFGYPPPKVEALIVKNRSGLEDLGAIAAMVDFANEARKAKTEGKILCPIGPRDLINWAVMTRRLGGDMIAAATVTVLAVAAEDRKVLVGILGKVRTELKGVEDRIVGSGKSVGSLVAELSSLAEDVDRKKAELEAAAKAELYEVNKQVSELVALRNKLKTEVENLAESRDSFAKTVQDDLLKAILSDAASKLSSGLKDALSKVGSSAVINGTAKTEESES